MRPLRTVPPETRATRHTRGDTGPSHLTPQPWEDSALCRELPWDDLDTAAQCDACTSCPVVDQCADLGDIVRATWAIGAGSHTVLGVYGGRVIHARKGEM